jgi:transcriptional regulator GlxA family with amidase domain
MTTRRHRVVCVLAHGMATSIGVAIANDLFGAPRQAEDLLGVPWYQYTVCTADPSPIRVGAVDVHVRHGVSALSRADTVIIPGRGTRPPPQELLAGLTRAYQRGARIVSFCTGAYVLAEAGLLDGRPATTLWTHAERFRARFPAVRLNPAVLYVDDGQVLTSAGNAASADLALHILRRDYGAEIANTIARQMVVPRTGAAARPSTSRQRWRSGPGPGIGSPQPWNGRYSGSGSRCRSRHWPRTAGSAHGSSPASSARPPAPPRTSGYSPSGSAWPSGSWRPLMRPSTI